MLLRYQSPFAFVVLGHLPPLKSLSANELLLLRSSTFPRDELPKLLDFKHDPEINRTS